MALMVPDHWEQHTERRDEARRAVGCALRDSLPEDHVILACGVDDFPAVDFLVATPSGLVFIMARGGIVDVLLPPGPDASWTHRDRRGYFAGAVCSEDLPMQATHLCRRLAAELHTSPRRAPENLGRGLLYVFPETTSPLPQALGDAGQRRRVLFAADLKDLALWVDRAAHDVPAAGGLDDHMRRAMEQAFLRLEKSARHHGRRGPLPMAAAGLAALAAGLALFALIH